MALILVIHTLLLGREQRRCRLERFVPIIIAVNYLMLCIKLAYWNVKLSLLYWPIITMTKCVCIMH